MEKKDKMLGMSLLEEAEQLKIYGGTTPMDLNITINIGSGCKKDRWSDCKTYCPIIIVKPIP